MNQTGTVPGPLSKPGLPRPVLVQQPDASLANAPHTLGARYREHQRWLHSLGVRCRVHRPLHAAIDPVTVDQMTRRTVMACVVACTSVAWCDASDCAEDDALDTRHTVLPCVFACTSVADGSDSTGGELRDGCSVPGVILPVKEMMAACRDPSLYGTPCLLSCSFLRSFIGSHSRSPRCWTGQSVSARAPPHHGPFPEAHSPRQRAVA